MAYVRNGLSLVSEINSSSKQLKFLASKTNLTYLSRQFIAAYMQNGSKSGTPAPSLRC